MKKKYIVPSTQLLTGYVDIIAMSQVSSGFGDKLDFTDGIWF